MKREFFLTDFRKFLKCSNLKTRPVGVGLFHVDGQTDGLSDGQKDRHDITNSHFSQFCEHA